MLQISKNEAVANVVLQQAEIRQRELEWYFRNYDTMAVQAAIFAAFAFDQLTKPLPHGTHFLAEFIYLALTASTLGFQLCVVTSCTFCCIFGKGLALRGPLGIRSIHMAIENLHREQKLIFTQFLLGTLGYLMSHILEIWIHFKPRVAVAVTIPLAIFILAISYYAITLADELVVTDDAAVTGQVHSLEVYEHVPDLDEELFVVEPTERDVLLPKPSLSSTSAT
eukprot:TRINITY_DN77008_c0_g1_i1.p1 TRINITY_DN77008_c0_g1~~TRINITY_DN77008_c0_g1_i1.p1  ORF type:complete len:224 (+),score=36.01 TRINITY_DN77008_c0_g1_i1:46-717(+)